MTVPDTSTPELEPLPDLNDLAAVLRFLRTQRTRSATNRQLGDDARKSGDAAGADTAWQTGSRQNLHALSGARSYAKFDQLFDKHGRPASGRNYPLQGDEAEFARIYCDTLGRQGGLYRRLGDLAKAREYYELGVPIEARSADLAFENSYNTLNAICIPIELRLASASPLKSQSVPSLRNTILAAREMVKTQIEKGTRSQDAWAKADLAMAILLSNDAEAARTDVPVYYDRYAAKADVDDIETTLRVMKGVLDGLRAMADPVAGLVEQGIVELRQAALNADKVVG